HPKTVAQAFVGVMQDLQGLLQIATPDVAAVDQAQGQDLVGGQAIKNDRVLLRRAHQVDVQAIHRQAGGQSQVVLQAAEVGGDQLLQRLLLQQVVNALEGVLPVLWKVEGKDRLVDLHPLHALGSQALEDLAIQRQQAVDQLQLVE